MRKGLFITFEGGEGSGKSTQIRLLKDYFEKQGFDVLLTREPGGSAGAEEIRKLLLHGTADRWDKLTEILLFSAARRDHLVKKIWPALAENKIVISDRFADSTTAYQCYGYGFDGNTLDAVQKTYALIAGDFKPDLTIVLDLDVETGLRRSIDREGNTEQRFENMAIQFHQNLRNAFLKLAESEPDRFVVIDADQSIETVHQDIIAAVQRKGLC